jgi:hypothetical protein
VDRGFFINSPGHVTVGKFKLMKFIAFGEAACKVKDNKEFGKEAIKGWENLSENFAKLLSCAHPNEAQYGLFC